MHITIDEVILNTGQYYHDSTFEDELPQKNSIIYVGCDQINLVHTLNKMAQMPYDYVVYYKTGDMGLIFHPNDNSLSFTTISNTVKLPSNVQLFSTNLDFHPLGTTIPKNQNIPLPLPLGFLETHANILLPLIDSQIQSLHGNQILYCNFAIHTNKKYRSKCWDSLLANGWTNLQYARHNRQKDSLEEWHTRYYHQLLQHKFAAAPRGHGLDTYRMWECIYCGTIPIVTRSYMTEWFAHYLPILVIDNWNIITKPFLEYKYKEFQNREYHYEMLKKSWWQNTMRYYVENPTK